ncbi:hypothetical protein CLU81_4728 [Flavobacterium sp. 9]|uniref:hypothetical protein n=1 Tax=Flavobacterium sp. 9 TaxID=2035198 RepID=UPI000C1805DB|nr:hypothetical protein [Flavobacterium sp. 9]PIF34094.1 hypothetical protein CLU81_4728 [Flavobacterium sp. 9]
MKKLILLLIIIATSISCNQSKQSKTQSPNVIDIKSLASKSKTEVEKILGKPNKLEPFSESSTPCKNTACQKGYYQNNKFEIIFVNEKADWITINDLEKYDFNEDNIEIFGLTKVEPEFKNPKDLIRWKNIEGFNEITIFNNGSDKISYAYIKVLAE